MKRQENQGHSLGLPIDFPVQISESTAMVNNTAGLWQSRREGRGKIMAAKRKRGSVSVF